ncbi:Hypothetical predicted protein [Olea europaea subsp. europaea]|uniref:Uncharacterized protein n=1 Tax=Olea europaea subsp. europaea TaxID=158383 RepID=A0A8S0U7L1_OLEEU|nr:Hypothetical predicted protein [Olea europaea subsp. europaea]
MGGLVVKQMLYQAKAENKSNFVNNTVGVVFYSCPHFGSKLANVPWRIGLVLWPVPSTKVTPIVEGYGSSAFRMEIVPMESAYPRFGQLVDIPGLFYNDTGELNLRLVITEKLFFVVHFHGL